MNTLYLPDLGSWGRWGNQLIQYASAKNIACKNGLELVTNRWDGVEILCLKDSVKMPDGIDDLPEFGGAEWIAAGGQRCLQDWKMTIYKRPLMQIVSQKGFYDLYGELRSLALFTPHVRFAVHHRKGDNYASNDWPQISDDEIRVALVRAGVDPTTCEFFYEENPHVCTSHPLFEKYKFLTDFCMMIRADNLFVFPASTFSIIAGMLSSNQLWVPTDYRCGPTIVNYVKKA